MFPLLIETLDRIPTTQSTALRHGADGGADGELDDAALRADGERLVDVLATGGCQLASDPPNQQMKVDY